MQPLIDIGLVMLVSGVFGGLANSFLLDAQLEQRLPWWQHVVVGIVAAFMVPLFLNVISGDLIDKIRGPDGTGGDYSKMFVLAGFCLVAAVSSRAFIKTMSEKMLQNLQRKVDAVDKKADVAVVKSESAQVQASAASADANEARQAVAPLVEDDATPEADAAVSFGFNPGPPPIETTTNESAVLKALTDTKFALRSLTGISSDAGLAKTDASAAISKLLAKDLIGETLGKSGQPRWFLTKAGRLRSLGR